MTMRAHAEPERKEGSSDKSYVTGNSVVFPPSQYHFIVILYFILCCSTKFKPSRHDLIPIPTSPTA